MANTLQMRMTATVIDELNTEAECTVYGLCDPTVALSSILTTYSAWLSALDAITGGRIIRAQVALYPQLLGLKGSTVAGSRVSQTGLLAFTGPATPRRESIAVPALLNTLISGSQIITTTGPIATFWGFIQTGGTSLEPTTSDFDGPLTFKDSSLSFRKYNRQLSASSFTLV